MATKKHMYVVMIPAPTNLDVFAVTSPEASPSDIAYDIRKMITSPTTPTPDFTNDLGSSSDWTNGITIAASAQRPISR